MLVAFDDTNQNPDYRWQRFIALVFITFVCLIHVFSRKMGIFVNNALAAYKVALLLFVVIAGFACLAGAGGEGQKADEYGKVNLQNAFADSSGSPYAYASALLNVLYAYQGWENANYVGTLFQCSGGRELTPGQVLAEVKRPERHEPRTFKRAILLSFATVTTLYILANVAYVKPLSCQ